MISDLALGILAASTFVLALAVASGSAAIAFAARWLARFADVRVTKDSRGVVKVSAEVRGNGN